jgi:hypothetical protein
MAEVVAAYKDRGDANGVKQVQSSGLHIAGERFVVLKADDRSVYGKKVSKTPKGCGLRMGWWGWAGCEGMLELGWDVCADICFVWL